MLFPRSSGLSGEMSSKDANFHPMTYVNEHLDDEDMKVSKSRIAEGLGCCSVLSFFTT